MPAAPVDLVEVAPHLALGLVGQGLDEPRAAERVDRGVDAGLLGDDLLLAEGEQRGLGGRHGERLVVGVGVERLGPAQDAGQRLERDPGQVVERLLRGQRHAGGLGVEAHPGAALVLGAVALGHQVVPDPPAGPELGDLLEEVAVAVEEERQPRREVVDAQAALEGRLDVGHPVGDRERQLLDRGRAGLADVVAADRDRVPARQSRASRTRSCRSRGASTARAGTGTPSGR